MMVVSSETFNVQRRELETTIAQKVTENLET